MYGNLRKICQVNDTANRYMESSQHRYRMQLETTPWFRGLSVELKDYLISHAKMLTLEKGQFLYRRGEKSYGLYAVLGGALSIGAIRADGKEALLAVLGPTAWIGEISMFDGLPRPNDVAANTRALLLHIPESALNKLLEEKPSYWRDFALLMAQRLRLSFDNAEAMTMLPGPQRVANQLANDSGRVWRTGCRAQHHEAFTRFVGVNGIAVAADNKSDTQELGEPANLEHQVRGNRYSGF